MLRQTGKKMEEQLDCSQDQDHYRGWEAFTFKSLSEIPHKISAQVFLQTDAHSLTF